MVKGKTAKYGTLFIVATPIGNLGDISARALETLANVDLVAAEDTRTSGQLLQHFGIKQKFVAYHVHNEAAATPRLVEDLKAGKNVALVSDAGLPIIADPGHRLVAACQHEGIKVTVVPGANAALAALILSGLPAERFYFHGFLPSKSSARKKELQDIAALPSTVIFYEAPHRLVESLADIKDMFGDRDAAVVREITKLFEEANRNQLSALIDYYEATPPKGECVIIVAGKEAVEATAQDIDALLQHALQTLKTRDAAKAVAAQTGEPVSELYARALHLKGEA